MTAMFGTDPSFDYRQMYDMTDRRGDLPLPVVHPNSIFYELATNPQLSMFKDMVEHTGLVGVLNDPHAKFTLFAPLNTGIPPHFQHFNNYTLRRIILQHMLEKAVPLVFLTSSQGMLVNTRVPGSSLLVRNMNGATIINDFSRVVGNKIVGNCQIIFVDKIIPPDSNPLSNVSV